MSWVRWSVKWRGRIQGDGGVAPPLFRTRAECRRFIEERYGYIKHRPDLRGPPHNWRMPVPVKVQITEVEA